MGMNRMNFNTDEPNQDEDMSFREILESGVHFEKFKEWIESQALKHLAQNVWDKTFDELPHASFDEYWDDFKDLDIASEIWDMVSAVVSSDESTSPGSPDPIQHELMDLEEGPLPVYADGVGNPIFLSDNNHFPIRVGEDEHTYVFNSTETPYCWLWN